MSAKKEIRYTSQGHLYKMSWVGGGEMPADLSGLYTSKHEAKAAFDSYIEKRDAKK